MSTVNQKLETCGCCDPGVPSQTVISNRSGLPRLGYRIGTHADFFKRMLHRIPYQVIPDGDYAGERPLGGLTTRSLDDPSIALLDAWAMSLDVLTFYQEQLANEGFLRTSTERRSVLELARSIGYELNPGVAAGTWLAFQLATGPKNPRTVRIAVGMQLLSVPQKDELPQRFEVAEEMEARPDWNRMVALTRETPRITADTTVIHLKGTGTALQPGDLLLLVGDERASNPRSDRWVVVTISSVEINADRNTVLTLDKSPREVRGEAAMPANPRVFALRTRTSLFGYNAPDWKILTQAMRGNFGNGDDWQGLSVPADAAFDLAAEFPRVVPGSWVVLSGPVERTIDGQTSTTRAMRLYRVRTAEHTSRTDFTLTAQVTHVVPDTPPPGPVLVGESADAASRDAFQVRGTQVLAESELLELAEAPVVQPVQGATIVVQGNVLGLTPGRSVIVSGTHPRMLMTRTLVDALAQVGSTGYRVIVREGAAFEVLAPSTPRDQSDTAIEGASLCRAGGAGCDDWQLLEPGGTRRRIALPRGSYRWADPPADADQISEVAVIRSVSNDNNNTTITFESALTNIYDRASAAVLGNVARATHGASVAEVLGSGDATVPNQRFKLKKPPLTHIAAPTATGAKSTLEVRVNGVLWQEVPYLYGRGAREEVYIVRINNEGEASVIFGDGRNGARLPSGLDNVAASYRSGIGLEGEVPVDSLTIMQSRPLGVSDVTNPVAATGAASAEHMEDARRNAPTTVLTFERIVSLRDFEDFSQSFAGVAKAQAEILWNGSRQIVHVTIGGSNGKPAGPGLRRNLATAIDALRDRTIEMRIGSYREKRFNLKARVICDPRYLVDVVTANVQAALLEAFSYDRRSFAQSVSSSEVISVIQKVAGVVYVDLDELYISTLSDCGGSATPRLVYVLTASRAKWVDSRSRCGGRSGGGLLLTGGITVEQQQQQLGTGASSLPLTGGITLAGQQSGLSTTDTSLPLTGYTTVTTSTGATRNVVIEGLSPFQANVLVGTPLPGAVPGGPTPTARDTASTILEAELLLINPAGITISAFIDQQSKS